MGINQGKATAICLFNIDNGSLAEAQLSSKIISLISVGSLAGGEACEHVNAGWRRKCVCLCLCVWDIQAFLFGQGVRRGNVNVALMSMSELSACLLSSENIIFPPLRRGRLLLATLHYFLPAVVFVSELVFIL